MPLALRLLTALLLAAASLEIIRDGKATYGVLAAGEKPSIVSERIKMSEVDAMAKTQNPAPAK